VLLKGLNKDFCLIGQLLPFSLFNPLRIGQRTARANGKSPCLSESGRVQ